MGQEPDYEQLYYDMLNENRKLKNEIKLLETELQEINASRTKRNIDLQKYLYIQVRKYKEEKWERK